jgi:signal transduction histidine kinase
LIVDDNAALSSTLQEILEEEGYRVSLAQDAVSALEQAETTHFSLTIIDIKLPGMQGDELASKLTALHPGLPCLFMTGHATLESAIAAVGLNGVVGYELKPLDIDRLLTLVKQVIARQIAEEEVRQKTEELDKILSVRSEFLSIVSHELRGPLVPIVGYSEMLLTGEFGEIPEDFYDPVRSIHESAENLRALVDDILLVTKMERVRFTLDIEDIRVRPFIDELVKSYMDTDTEKHVELTRDGEDISIQADRGRLRQILENLISNSIKYSGETVRITVETSQLADMGRFSVSDNGLGIPKEHLPYIFDRFYQFKHPSLKTQHGSGLGLSIVRELTEKMGGSVEVESEPGKGSTFTISLPLSVAGSTAPETETAAATGITEDVIHADSVEPEPAPLRILVIDDDSFTLELVSKMLEKNYVVLTAQTGETGLSMLKEKPVDIVLLDWLMPGLDGLGVLAAIRANSRTRDIPVVFLSGKSESEWMERGLDAGAVDFVTKPFKRMDLIERIERLRPLIPTIEE